MCTIVELQEYDCSGLPAVHAKACRSRFSDIDQNPGLQVRDRSDTAGMAFGRFLIPGVCVCNERRLVRCTSSRSRGRTVDRE
jgi:hypothetical protein